MNPKAILERRPLACYVVLVYALTWGGILILLGPEGLRPASTRSMAQALLVFVAMLLGPSLTGVTLTAVLDRSAGLRELLARWRRWRLGWRSYAAALLTTPLVLLAIGAALTRFSPVFTPGLIASDNRPAVLGFGLTIGMLAGLVEEIGWTGFALPRLLSRYSAPVAGLLLGALWGSWHVLSDYWGNAGAFGSLYLARALLWVLTLTAYRMLMVQVYQRAPSLLLMQLMHASFTGWQVILEPALGPANYLLWYGTFSGVLWLLVAVSALKLRQAAQGLRPQLGGSN